MQLGDDGHEVTAVGHKLDGSSSRVRSDANAQSEMRRSLRPGRGLYGVHPHALAARAEWADAQLSSREVRAADASFGR
jgi:hypothetical protein